jgi:hypothetical protein
MHDTSVYIHHLTHDFAAHHHIHDDMSSTGESPQKLGHDTGFPAHVCAKTTSRRHPDAIVTPGHSISAEDIDPARSLVRSRKSSRHSKYKRTISYGKISPEQRAPLRANTGMNSIDSAIDLPDDKPPTIPEVEGRPSKETDSIGHTDGSSLLQDELTPITPVSPDAAFGSRPGSKAESLQKKSFFNRFRRD